MVGKDERGGGGGSGVEKATQEQVRLARLTQDPHSLDNDDTHFMKLVKKVMETTRCTQSTAEIALFDSDNNVESAVDAILEKSLSDNWQKQKSRKTKKMENEEEALRQRESEQRRLVCKRGEGESASFQQQQNRALRGGNAPRRGGRGGMDRRGGGSTRGTAGTRGGVKSSTRGGGSGNRIGTWQGDQQENTWDNSMAGTQQWNADDTAEDTDWKNGGTLVFQRKDDVHASPSSGAAAPPSFAAVAAAAVTKTVESASTGNDLRPSLDHSTHAVYDSSLVTSSLLSDANASGGDAASTESFDTRTAHSPRHHNAGLNVQSSTANGVAPTSTSTSSHVQTTPAPAAVVWTEQLKNDLGIGGSRLPPARTVEFVSMGGDVGGAPASALPEYQFGFHVEPSDTSHHLTSVEPVEPIFVATSTAMPTAISTRSHGKSSEQQVPSSLSNGGSSLSQQLQSSMAEAARTAAMRPNPYTIPSLPYMDNLSYSSNKQAPSAPPPSQHLQYNTASAPLAYNFPYMSMYSPVTGGIRAEDASQYAAALMQQYPFNMGMDMGSLSTMLPSVQSAQQPHSRGEQHSAAAFAQDYNKVSYGGGSSQQRVLDIPTSVAPPPGFSGPPGNAAVLAASAAAAFSGMHQSSLNSLFQGAMMQPGSPYHPQAFPFMLPSVTPGNGQHKMTQMYSSAPPDDDQRAKAHYDNKLKDARGGLANQHQPTPPPGIQGQYAPPGAQGFVANAQLQPLLAKKPPAYSGAQQHWQ